MPTGSIYGTSTNVVHDIIVNEIKVQLLLTHSTPSSSTCIGSIQIQLKQNTNIYNIYNSVVTCRHIAINSSASDPLNATKIAVKKVSDIQV